MYCIKCGVKLCDSEDKCPLCGTVPYHPDITRIEIDPLYPKKQYPVTQVSRTGALIITSAVFLLALVITLVCDLLVHGAVTWSGYVIGALILTYEIIILPLWFKKPNPVIFLPCDFLSAGAYLLYINVVTGGRWFMTFAFPITAYFAVVFCTVVTLLKYVRRGTLYKVGGMFISLGVLMPLIEHLVFVTFKVSSKIAWSPFPLAALAFVGGFLIFLGICRPAREAMERKFFI